MKSRRGFLKALGLGAAGAAIFPALPPLQAQDGVKDFDWEGEPPKFRPSQMQQAGVIPKSDTVPVMLTNESLISRKTVERYRELRFDLSTTDNLELKLCDEGTKYILDCGFCNQKAHTCWHVGLIDNSCFTCICRDDSYFSINQAGNGWDEFTDYETERPTLDYSAFDFTAVGTIKGFFVAGGDSSGIKGNRAPGNVLFSINLFPQGDISVVAGDRLAFKL